MQLTEEFIRRIARRVNQTNGGATISNLINGGTTVGKAVEANHATTAANLDSDSSDWQTIDDKDTAAKDAANQYTDEQLAAALKELASKYISKTDDDSAEGFITFLAGILFGSECKWGITAEGVATLANLLTDLLTVSGLVKAGSLETTDIHSPGANNNGDQSGSGFYLWVDGGVSNMTLDNLTVRGKWTAAILEVLKLQYTAGNLTLTGAGGEIYAVKALMADGNEASNLDKDTTLNKSSVDRYRCYFKATDGERHVDNLWHVGDIVRCQTFNLTDGTYKNAANRMYGRVVVAVGTETEEVDGVECFYIDLSNCERGTLDDGTFYYGLMHTRTNGNAAVYMANDAPEAGDSVAHVGSVNDSDRQGAVQLVAVGGEAIRIYGGINETLYDLSRFIRIQLSPDGSYINSNYLTYTNGYNTNHPMIQCGDWTTGTTAHPTEVWQYDGSSWLCVEETTDAPSEASSAWTLLAAKGETGASYDVQLSRYQGMITVDDLGNVIGGLYSTSSDGVKQYKLSTAVFVRKGTDILLWEEGDGEASEGHYKLHVESDSCESMIANSTVYITKIANLHDSNASSVEAMDYDAMRKMNEARITIVVDCEGKAAKTIEMPIRIAHDSLPFMTCDLSNEHASVGWNTYSQGYYGLPVETGVALMYQNQGWDIDYITVKAQGASATAVNNSGTMEAADVTEGYTATLGVDLEGEPAIITLLPTGLKCSIDSPNSSDSLNSCYSKVLRLTTDGTGTGDFIPQVMNLDVHVAGTYAGVVYEYDKVWTIDKANDVTLYELAPSVDTVVVDSDGVISDSHVSCDVWATSSDGNRWKVSKLSELGMMMQSAVDSLTEWTDNSNEVDLTTDNLYAAFRLVSTDKSIVYDRETIPVSKQGKDGTSFQINGTARGYFGAGNVDMPTVADYMTSIGYTPSTGDLCLYSPTAVGDATIYEYDGSAWTDAVSAESVALTEGDCWLVDQTLDTDKDGHLLTWVKQDNYRVWKDMGALKGPAGRDGKDAEWYELVAEPGSFHLQKDGTTWDGSVVVRLRHHVGSTSSDVTGASLTITMDSSEPTTMTGTSPLTIDPTSSTYSQYFDDAQRVLGSVTITDEDYDASDLTIPVQRDGEDGEDGEDGVGYYINPSAIVITESVDTVAYDSTTGVVDKANTTYLFTGIPTSVAIHKTVGATDNIVEASEIKAVSGSEMLLSGWLDSLKASFTSAGGYDFTAIMDATSLNSYDSSDSSDSSDRNKIELQFTVDGVELICDVYINRLGTTTIKTIGDTTTELRNKVVNEISEGYVKTSIFNGYTEKSAERFQQHYSNTTVSTEDGVSYTVSSKFEQTASRISFIVDGLTKTGIDITDGKIEATADQFSWKNSDGDQTMAVDADGNLTINNVIANGIKAEGGTFTDINAENGTYTNITAVGGTFTNATVTGKITATSGEIAGFTINSNFIGTRSNVIGSDEDSYGSHENMWLTDSLIGFNATDRQTIVGTFSALGVPMLGRFYDETSEYAPHYGIVAAVRNMKDESEVLTLEGGCVSGLALKVKVVDCSSAAQSVTLGRDTVAVTSIGTKACNLTLPVMYPYDDGHVIIIKGAGTGGVNIYPNTYVNTSSETVNTYLEYNNGDVVVAPSGYITLGNSMDSMMLVFHIGLKTTVNGTTYYGCWMQYKLPRSW